MGGVIAKNDLLTCGWNVKKIVRKIDLCAL